MDCDRRTDAELLRATSGEVEAFGVFYRRHVEWVLGFLARRLGDAELAADLTSEVFAAAPLSSHRYDPAVGQPAGWLYGIVAHKLATTTRRGAAERRARRRLAMTSVPVAAADIEWIDALARADDGRVAMGLLSSLPGDQREVVMARGLQERGYAEIAAAAGERFALVPAQVCGKVNGLLFPARPPGVAVDAPPHDAIFIIVLAAPAPRALFEAGDAAAIATGRSIGQWWPDGGGSLIVAAVPTGLAAS